jgi:hypothetical protein
MGLFGVTELFEPAAKVELMGVAVIGEPSDSVPVPGSHPEAP